MSKIILVCAALSQWIYEQKTDDIPFGFKPIVASDRVVLFSDQMDNCVVAYRGTDSIQDFFHDITSQAYQVCNKKTGFLNEFEASFGEISTITHDQINTNLQKCRTIHFTGHSLGGAMAIIGSVSYDIKRHDGVITFGGPKICCGDDSRVQGITRVVNEHDPIPALPEPLELTSLSNCGCFAIRIPSNNYTDECAWPTLLENHNILDHEMKRYMSNVFGYINSMRALD